MTMKKVTASFLGLAMLAVGPITAFAADDGVARVFSPDLMTLPEDRDGSVLAPEAGDYDAAGQVIDDLLAIHVNALADLEANEQFQKEAESAKSRANLSGRKPWHLSALALDLGVSAQGALGVLFARGEALINLYLRRLHDGYGDSRTQPPDLESDNLGLGWTRALSPGELVAQVEPLVRTLLATGQVRDDDVLRQSLYDAATDFNALVAGLQPVISERWTPTRLRLDFAVDASGMVHPGVTVGGGLKIRFDWFPRPASADVAAYLPPTPSPRADSMNRLMRQLADAVSHVRYDDAEGPHALRLNQAVFSLGMTVAGDFGVARGSLSAVGFLYLSKNTAEAATEAPAPSGLDSDIPLVEAKAERRHLDYARAHDIAFTTSRMPSGEKEAVYSLPADGLQAGLERAVRMGQSFAERAQRRRSKNWEVSQLRTQFTLSIGGTVGVVTVTGSGAVQLVFNAA